MSRFREVSDTGRPASRAVQSILGWWWTYVRFVLELIPISFLERSSSWRNVCLEMARNKVTAPLVLILQSLTLSLTNVVALLLMNVERFSIPALPIGFKLKSRRFNPFSGSGSSSSFPGSSKPVKAGTYSLCFWFGETGRLLWSPSVTRKSIPKCVISLALRINSSIFSLLAIP